MGFIESLMTILREIFKKKDPSPALKNVPYGPIRNNPEPAAVPAVPDPNIPRAREDEQLTLHFSLYELTYTNRTEHLDFNRVMTNDEKGKLKLVAQMLEECRRLQSGPLEVHSGRRYPALNSAIGGSKRSQHMRCEAADMSPLGPDTEESMRDLFQKIWDAGKRGEIKFGQLILESDKKRNYNRVWWIHISLGAPYRSIERCGEVLEMRDGRYTTVGKVSA